MYLLGGAFVRTLLLHSTAPSMISGRASQQMQDVRVVLEHMQMLVVVTQAASATSLVVYSTNSTNIVGGAVGECVCCLSQRHKPIITARLVNWTDVELQQITRCEPAASLETNQLLIQAHDSHGTCCQFCNWCII